MRPNATAFLARWSCPDPGGRAVQDSGGASTWQGGAFLTTVKMTIPQYALFQCATFACQHAACCLKHLTLLHFSKVADLNYISKHTTEESTRLREDGSPKEHPGARAPSHRTSKPTQIAPTLNSLHRLLTSPVIAPHYTVRSIVCFLSPHGTGHAEIMFKHARFLKTSYSTSNSTQQTSHGVA